MTTTVVNVKKANLQKAGYTDFKDWNKNKNHVYIGRNMTFYVPGTEKSIWYNPYPVAKPSTKINKSKSKSKSRPTYTREESMRLYKKHIESSPELLSRLNELKGKTLGCWCKPLKCHGDVLVKLIEKHCK